MKSFGAVPLTWTITSPFCNPAYAAGLSGSTSVTVSRLGHFGDEDFRKRFGHLFDGYGKSDTVTFAVNGHVQTNELAAQVDERPAAAAGVDGRVGLEPVGDVQRLVLQGRAPVFGTEDAAADRTAQAERIAQRQHRLARQ